MVAEFRHRIGDEVMMRHRRHWKLKPAPFAHLTGVGAAGIYHMFAADRAALGLDKPFAASLSGDVGGTAAPNDLHTLGARAGGKRLRDAGGVRMTVFGRVQRAKNTVQIIKRVMAADLVRPDKLDREPKRTANAHRMAKPVHFVFCVGEAE